jgi:hypothetical protein
LQVEAEAVVGYLLDLVPSLAQAAEEQVELLSAL